jgi:hypothetical protein
MRQPVLLRAQLILDVPLSGRSTRHVGGIEMAVCLYTDGLIERPGESIDVGLARLCQVVEAEPAHASCAAVMAALVGSEPARDGIALL